MTSARSAGLTSDRVATAIHGDIGTLEARIVRRARRAARNRHLAAVRVAQRQAPPATAQPAPAPAPSSSSGGDAAQSPLGVCIRDAEEGGSYAWGPGNGGGAYQFLLGTWEKYGGAASEYGVAGPAYQDQIFDNAIAAGGASNWTSYDGC
jgi:Transglycosylase-like domain